MFRSIVALALCVPLVVFAQGPRRSAEQAWNDLYSKREGKEHQFNKFLAETVKDRKPGSALDIGMGQGRNSLFLAALGWQVTGFDISAVGVKQAQEEAKKRDLKIDARVGDVDKFDYDKNKWDLVVGMYMHEYLTRNAAKIVESLKPGGVLAVHISNRYLDLVPVVQQAARHLSLELRQVENDDDDDAGVYRSDWMLVSASPAAFEGKELKEAADRIDAVPSVRLWTDDYSDLYRILK